MLNVPNVRSIHISCHDYSFHYVFSFALAGGKDVSCLNATFFSIRHSQIQPTDAKEGGGGSTTIGS